MVRQLCKRIRHSYFFLIRDSRTISTVTMKTENIELENILTDDKQFDKIMLSSLPPLEGENSLPISVVDDVGLFRFLADEGHRTPFFG